ncbi:hypothetical protein IW147_005686 [Coemansia sp. RSA 720]|nr:hypothetical protein IW147_005686 [Coemansia sp. RSA 720]
MVHDRRMPKYDVPGRAVGSGSCKNWASDRCIVRLRRDNPDSRSNMLEISSNETVTGLRFSRDEPNLVIASWCYDYVYLFDLNHSSAYSSALNDNDCTFRKGRRCDSADSMHFTSAKRIRIDSASALAQYEDDVVDMLPSRGSSRESYMYGSGEESDLFPSTSSPRDSAHVREFGRGLYQGVRMLTQDEAPYLFSNSSSSSISNAASDGDHMYLCSVCQRDTRNYATITSRLSAQNYRASDRMSSLSSVETALVAESLAAFVSSMDTHALSQALASVSFALRSLDGEGHHTVVDSHITMLLLGEGPASEDFKRVMLAMYSDPSLNRRRIHVFTSSQPIDIWPQTTREYLPDILHTPSVDDSDDAYNQVCINDIESRDGDLGPVPVILPSRRYWGHCNAETIKDVNFVFDRYVASGSDDGCLFIWDRQTMNIVQLVRGDNDVVNIIEGHPALPIIAISGIGSDVQIFHLSQRGPAAAHQRNFPMVQQTHMLAAGLRDPAARQACISRAYATDHYASELEHSGHSLLPQGFNINDFIPSSQQLFPAVSTSMLATVDDVTRMNEEMRIDALGSAGLRDELMRRLLLSEQFNFNESDSSNSGSDISISSISSDDDSLSSSGSDVTSSSDSDDSSSSDSSSSLSGTSNKSDDNGDTDSS